MCLKPNAPNPEKEGPFPPERVRHSRGGVCKVLQPSHRFLPGTRGNGPNAMAPAGSPTLPPEVGQHLAGNMLPGSISSLHFSISQALLCHLLVALAVCTQGHCLTYRASVFSCCLIRSFLGLNKVTR